MTTPSYSYGYAPLQNPRGAPNQILLRQLGPQRLGPALASGTSEASEALHGFGTKTKSGSGRVGFCLGRVCTTYWTTPTNPAEVSSEDWT